LNYMSNANNFNLSNYKTKKLTFEKATDYGHGNFRTNILLDGSSNAVFCDDSMDFTITNFDFKRDEKKNINSGQRHSISCVLYANPEKPTEKEKAFKEMCEYFHNAGVDFIVKNKTDFGFKTKDKDESVREKLKPFFAIKKKDEETNNPNPNLYFNFNVFEQSLDEKKKKIMKNGKKLMKKIKVKKLEKSLLKFIKLKLKVKN